MTTILDHLECDTKLAEGDILEFGVGIGYSFSDLIGYILERGLFKSKRLFGFDSFKGLPREANGLPINDEWKEGSFYAPRDIVQSKIDTLISEYTIPKDRIIIVEGYFLDTLNDSTKVKYGIKKACIVNIDSDLYISAIQALYFIKDLLVDGTLIYFNDWGGVFDGGERRAFEEFVTDNPLEFVYLHRNDTISGDALVKIGG